MSSEHLGVAVRAAPNPAINGPSLALLAHPSEFVNHDDAAHLQNIGMEVWALPHTTHSMHREDYELFLLAIDRWRNHP